MTTNIELTLLPEQISFDHLGRVKVENDQFVAALSSIPAGALADASCNNGCGDTGCGNTVNGGCGSTSKLHFDDWQILDASEAIVNNADLTKALIHAKIANDETIPTLISFSE